jgi:hypothetical protein
LLVLADLAGGHWPELAREAALGIMGRAQEQSPIGALLLDMCVAFLTESKERLFSREVVSGLMGIGQRPWSELLKRKPVTELWLAQQLRPYGIKPKTMRIEGKLGKGYQLEDCMETFRRYIPKSAVDELKAEVSEQAAEQNEAQASAPERTEKEPEATVAVSMSKCEAQPKAQA